jgi:transcriptional regulator NrdR family protein
MDRSVTKRSGDREGFNAAKLTDSLKRAGASEAHARVVSEIVANSAQDGADTTDIRRLAASELKRLDGASARRYEAYAKQ